MEEESLLMGVGKGCLGSVVMARIPMDVDLQNLPHRAC